MDASQVDHFTLISSDVKELYSKSENRFDQPSAIIVTADRIWESTLAIILYRFFSALANKSLPSGTPPPIHFQAQLWYYYERALARPRLQWTFDSAAFVLNELSGFNEGYLHEGFYGPVLIMHRRSMKRLK